MTHTLSNGYPSFSAVKGNLPELERTEVTTGVELETLFLPGPDPTIVFIHGGLGSLWNPYLQLDAFRGEQGLSRTRSLEMETRRLGPNRPLRVTLPTSPV